MGATRWAYTFGCALVLVVGCDSEDLSEVRAPADNTPAVADLRCESDPRKPCERYHLSLIELIAQPEKYDGKRVQVEGFAELRFEANALYVSRDAWENHLAKSAVWLEEPTNQTPGATKFRWNRRYVTVAGTFSATDTGHMGAYSGALRSISFYRGISGDEPGADESWAQVHE